MLEIPFEGARSVVAGAAKTFTFDGSAKTAARKSTYRTPDAIIVKMKSGAITPSLNRSKSAKDMPGVADTSATALSRMAGKISVEPARK